RLRDEEIIDIDAELAGVDGVEGVFDVDERRHAAALLGFGDDLERDGGLTGGFRSEDFADAAAGEAAGTEGRVDRDRARGDHRDGDNGFLRSEPYNRPFAELLFDLAESLI